ncbi:MAG TPA: hypothetical protein VGV59_01470 [Pyrinomonadaceae bacterium]|nr:hypothetical protein [Pyrinomonadaceae bacterium]
MKFVVSFVLAWLLLAAVGKGTAVRAATGAESAKTAGDVVVVLNEGFLNALLEAVLEQPNPPKFPLSKSGGGGSCPSEIMLSREEQGKRTAVVFQEGRVTAPVAFRGSYSAPLLGCFRFEGWADTVFNLAFDPARQAFTARVEVRNISLNKIPALLGGSITQLVQDAIDERVNPVEVLRAEQLAAQLPVTRESVLRLRAREIQHQVAGKELRLRIVYEIVR